MEAITYKEAINFEHLYESAMKCKNSVQWKDSTAHFMINIVSEVERLNEQLISGTYKPRKPVKFTISTPKKREIISVSFVDRVYQRSLNDNILYPVKYARKGKITKKKVDECFNSILNHIDKGNTYYYSQKFKRFYKKLWEEKNEDN